MMIIDKQGSWEPADEALESDLEEQFFDDLERARDMNQEL